MYLLQQHKNSYAFTTVDDESVLTYQFDDFFYHPHIHPIHTPSGNVLTMTLPGDHPWHNGMYFSWKFLNGYNVWDRDFYDNLWGKPVHRHIEPIPDPTQANRFIGFRHTICWVTQDGEELLEDTRTIIIGAVNECGAYSIDWHNATVALAPEVVLERKPEWGGYAGLHTRLVRCVAPEISNSNGTNDITEDNEELAEWMDYRFWVDGLASRTHFEFWSGITVMSHPDNVRHPSPFRGYFEKNIQSVHVPVLRDELVTLQQGEQLTLSYRQMVYDGKPERATLDKWFTDYRSSKPVS